MQKIYSGHKMSPRAFLPALCLDLNCSPEIIESQVRMFFIYRMGAELQNVNFFTQIIYVQPNLPQEKARKSRHVFIFTFNVLNGHKKQI